MRIYYVGEEPNGVEFSIEDGVLTAIWLNGVTEVVIPNNVTSIGNKAFRDCSGLTSVTIPDSVTSIGNYAFEGCSGLTSVTIPNSVTNIGDSAFYKCSGLTSVTIGDSVISIGEEAFYECSGLTSVTIPDSVTNIGEEAFYECSGLTSVTIGNGVTRIGDSVFAYCIGMTSIAIGNSVTSIGDCAFEACIGLTSVTIPNSVTDIGWQAFSYCSGLTSVTFDGDAPTIDSYCFCYVNSSCGVYVNKGSTGWGVAIPGTWNGLRIEYLPMAFVAADATPESVTNAIETAGFADAEAVKAVIGGSAKEYGRFKSWAGSVAGGEAAVVANTNAAAAYLLGAERLFENAPKVEFCEMEVGELSSGGALGGGLGTSRPTMTLAITVKDGDDAVKCATEKVAAMFEATGDLGDWSGESKLSVGVEAVEPTDPDSAVMRFKVTPGDGTSPHAFLRIRK